MWRDHLFSQRDNSIKRAVGVEVGGGVGQNLKKEGVGNIGAVRNLLPTLNLFSPFVQIECDFVSSITFLQSK